MKQQLAACLRNSERCKAFNDIPRGNLATVFLVTHLEVNHDQFFDSGRFLENDGFISLYEKKYKNKKTRVLTLYVGHNLKLNEIHCIFETYYHKCQIGYKVVWACGT